MRYGLSTIITLLICSSLASQSPAATDSIPLTISRQLDEINVVQKRSDSPTTLTTTTMVVDLSKISTMPKFLGTSDPIRYLESLSGIQTNNETTSGIHIQGCDDYQTLVSINGAPIYYPNHLMGLFSTFNAPHFSALRVEQAVHNGQMGNRIGGWVVLQTQHAQPKRFSLTGNIGLVNSDLTLTIPCGKKSALFLSGRTSYINLLYSRWMRFEDIQLGYHFQDYNLTYSYHPTETDELLISGFYSRDKLGLTLGKGVNILWQNVMGSAAWTHRMTEGAWKTSVSFSGFDNKINATMDDMRVNTRADFASVDAHSFYQGDIAEALSLTAGADYHCYLTQPLLFDIVADAVTKPRAQPRKVAHEASVYADIAHRPYTWFDYSIGLHGSLYTIAKQYFGAADPRASLHFHISDEHTLTLHGGLYTQYYHKSGLTNGGLPTDFYFLSDSLYRPERAVGTNLAYRGAFLNDKYVLSAELYFKQIYNIIESTANVLELVNRNFDYESGLLHSNGRNYGLNLMFQRTRGIVTGHVSYSLGWSRRQIPQLDGSTAYIYASSHERRHDLNIVVNAQVAKRWNIGANFVLASGLPYTRAEEAYVVNGQLFCRYSTFNGAHMPLYNRLDLSVSCDIIRTPEHNLGINLSLYNVYCHKNAQFVVYRDNKLKPIYGTSLSIVIPSISIYGTF